MKRQSMPQDLWQPMIIWHFEQSVTTKEKGLFKKPITEKLELSIPLTSDKVFLNKQDASLFIPNYIRELIQEGVIPPDVITNKNEIDESKISTCIRKANIIALDNSI